MCEKNNDSVPRMEDLISGPLIAVREAQKQLLEATGKYKGQIDGEYNEDDNTKN